MTSRTTATPIAGDQYRPATLTPFATWVSHGVRAVASCCNIHVLARSSAALQGVRSETRNAPATRIAASATQAVVVTAIRRGSGGGAPVGRRWRLECRTVEAADEPTAAPARAVLSLMTIPALARSALAPATSARQPRLAGDRPAPPAHPTP